MRNLTDTLERPTRRFILLDWLIPLALLLGLTILLRNTNLDLTILRCFFEPSGGWIYKDMQPWRFLYDFGTIPAIIIASASLATFIGSFWIRKITAYRSIALFLVLVMIVGPGLIVNTVFKEHWGRPRPRHIDVFSGQERFLRVWEKGVGGEGHSFPSGHASMGFYLLSPFFVVRKTSKKWAVVFLILGLSYGSLLGLARMVQGAHFFSDVIWAGGFVYLSGLGLYYLLRLDRLGDRTCVSPHRECEPPAHSSL